MKYCIRTDTFDIPINEDCFGDSKKWTFHDAVKQNITPNEVIMWSSSIENADNYAKFYYGGNYLESDQESFLCNCSRPGTFGPICEFELYHNTTTFEDAIKAQFEEKKDDRWGIQRYGDILCYETIFECDYGLLCLDWRDICDGEQQCMDGTDEENCDLLEFNECENDEYRCINGMCIAEKYWLDGQ
jgi:hypothetical protein